MRGESGHPNRHRSPVSRTAFQYRSLQRFSTGVAALVILLASLTVQAASTSSAGDLLVNGGFEQGVTGWGWYGAQLSVAGSPVHGGDSAASLVVAQAAGWLYQDVAIVPGESYTFSGYAQRTDPNVEKVLLRISWQDDAGEVSLNDSGTQLTSDSPDYRPLSVVAVAPSRARTARVEALVFNKSPGKAATAYFDDLSFTGPAFVPTPGPTPAPSPIPTGTPVPTQAPTATPVTTPASTPSPTPTPTPVITPIPTPVPTPVQTATPVPAQTPTPQANPTPTQSPPATSVPTAAPSPVSANKGDVVISEVQFDPVQPGNDAGFEWLELFNTTSIAVDLTGWKIGDNSRNDPLPALTIPPGGLVVIAATEAGFYANFPDYRGDIVFLSRGKIGNGLSNSGDRVILTDPAGNVIDALSYGDDASVTSPPYPRVAEGHSLQRRLSLPEIESSGFVDNPRPGPGFFASTEAPTALPPPVAGTPTPGLSVTATPTPTSAKPPTPLSSRTPAPDSIARQTPTWSDVPAEGMTSIPATVSPEAASRESPAQPRETSQSNTGLRIGILSLLLGSTILFAVVFWVKRK